MIRTAVCTIFIFSFVSVFSTSYADKIIAGKDLTINGRPGAPVTLEVTSLQNGKEIVKEIRPYSADMTGLKNELCIYRIVYFTLMTVVVGCLIWGVNAKH